MILIPGPFVLWVLLRNAVNVPFEDEWSWGALLAAMHDGTLSFNELWWAHNEHRMFFPKLVALGLAKSFGWNVVFESVVGIALLTLAQFSLFRMTRDTLGTAWGAVAFAVTSVVLFSLGQVENIMWGFQIAWFLIVFCTLSTIDLLRPETVRRIPALLAACLCAIAAFSSAFGLFVPMIAVFLVVTRRGVSPAQAALWMGFALLLALAYLYDLHRDFSQNHLGGSLVERIAYVCAYLGAPVAGAAGTTTSIWVGACGIGWSIVCAVVFARDPRALQRRWAPWIALLIFGVGCAAMTAYGRVVLGVGEALSSRYETLGAQFWLALVPLTVLVAARFGRNASQRTRIGLSFVAMAGFCLLGYGIAMQSVTGYQTASGTFAARSLALAALEGDPETASESTILTLHPDTSFVRKTVEELRKDGYWPLR